MKDLKGYELVLSSLFPYMETVIACDISTKEEIRVQSGFLIEAALINGKIYCCERIFKLLLKNGIQKQRIGSDDKAVSKVEREGIEA